MRLLMSVLGLLLVVAVVGLLSKRQMAAVLTLPASQGAALPAASTPAQSSSQRQQHYRQAIDDAMRSKRPDADDMP